MRALWLFLPLVGSALLHAPVLRYDLFRTTKRPLDGGATWRGRRLFGDHKTWRGAFFMFAGTFLATQALARWPFWWSRLPLAVQAAGPLRLGTLLGLGMVLAELPNSFLKRQLDIAPGGRRRSPAGIAISLLDQGDFVFGVWLLLAPIWIMPVAQAALAFAGVVAVHLLINVVGYAIGARTSWL